MAGIYIHIPFCRQACTYCNFHFSTSLSQKQSLLNAIHKEISIVASQRINKDDIETIYIGGGTPSLLSPVEIRKLIHVVRTNFSIAADAEITLEANPDDISTEILQHWLHNGINRLSVGIQSFKEDELQWMNRAHNSQQAKQSIDEIVQSGFNNFSVDLIYGSPLLSNKEFENNVQYIIDKNIPHLSGYALTVEPKTVLQHLIDNKNSPAVDEEKQAQQFEILVNMLEGVGYEQYEISNFARPGFRSRHNSNYWKGSPYYGIGPAAHSYNGKNIRSWNIANNALYISTLENNSLAFEEEHLTDTQRLNELIMISLRTMEGINLNQVRECFGDGHVTNILKNAQPYIDSNKIIVRHNKIKLTPNGKFFADGIAAVLFI